MLLILVIIVIIVILKRGKREELRRCREPSYDNPTMDVLLMSDDMELSACPGVDTDKYLLQGVYDDSKNLYRNKGLRRRFVTRAVTRYPPDSSMLGRQLYNPGQGCKTTNTDCKTYRDIRFSR